MIDRQIEAISRSVSVAPMMDWTDDPKTALAIRELRGPKRPCLLYVSSKILPVEEPAA